MYDHTLSKLAIYQIRHHIIDKVGCQPGDCIWSEWVNLLTLSPIVARGESGVDEWVRGCRGAGGWMRWGARLD